MTKYAKTHKKTDKKALMVRVVALTLASLLVFSVLLSAILSNYY